MNNTSPKTTRPGYVYVIQDQSGRTKIGHAINVTKRLKELQTGNSDKLTIYAIKHYRNRVRAETIIHEILTGYSTRGEWFRLDRQGKHLVDIIFGLEQPTEHEQEQLKRLKI